MDKADALLVVGSNPRREPPVLNARIRERWRAGNFPVGVIGEKADLTYPYDYLGAGPESLGGSAKANSPNTSRRRIVRWFWSVPARSPDPTAPPLPRLPPGRPRIRGAQGRLERLQYFAHGSGAARWLDLGCVPGEGALDTGAMLRAKAVDVLFLLGSTNRCPPGAFVVSIGTHGDRGAHRAT